ncbi:MAG TPA: hypothetical protein VM662_03630, partial [Sphingomonas sp.]|nr:hypothetical protein [Sphingomonas sp.]
EPGGIARESSVIWRKVLGQLWQERTTRTEIAADLNIPLDELQSLIWSLAPAPEAGGQGNGKACLALV